MPSRIPKSERTSFKDKIPLLSASDFSVLAKASLVATILIVATGAVVRLTGSGLGCKDWPTCSYGNIYPPLAFNAVIEFGNRVITALLSVLLITTFLASFRRRPFRKDLTWLSLGLVFGVLLEAGMGGIVVYSKLNPYVVALHFSAALPLIVDAAVLLYRSSRDYSSQSKSSLLVPPLVAKLAWIMTGLLGIVILAGTVTTGSGPHAGSTTGDIAKRIPISLRSIAELHSSLALLLVGFSFALIATLHAIDVPEKIRRTGRIFCATLVAQAAVGYTQYFTHLPVALVEIHVLGVTILVLAVTWFDLSLTHHGAEISQVP